MQTPGRKVNLQLWKREVTVLPTELSDMAIAQEKKSHCIWETNVLQNYEGCEEEKLIFLPGTKEKSDDPESFFLNTPPCGRLLMLMRAWEGEMFIFHKVTKPFQKRGAPFQQFNPAAPTHLEKNNWSIWYIGKRLHLQGLGL